MKKNKSHIAKSSGFKIPENYFESFDEKLFQHLDDQHKDKVKFEEIESAGFKTPDNYFNTVENDILNKLKAEDKPKVVSLFSKKRLYYISGIAASLLLLFAIFINKPETQTLSVDMVQNYLAESDLDSYDLAELLSETDILEENFTITETYMDPDNIESYLLEHADLETIIE